MVRKASRQQKNAPQPTPKKRALSPTMTTPLRQSKRAKSTSVTPKAIQTTPRKSQYFDPEDESSESEVAVQNEESGYEDEDRSASAMSSPPASEDEEDGEEYVSVSEKEKKPRRGRPAKKSSKGVVVANGTKGQELWRPGVKTGLAPGEQIFIKLPKAREAGKTPYKDNAIHPNTFLFLGDLKENNDREWLKVHDADYRQSKKDFDTFIECLTEKIIEKDETIPELPSKDVTFRIYRDVRFSSDPTPYKVYFSAAWSRTGRKGPYAHYYVHIQPGSSFVGGGIWHPDAQPLALLRRDVDRKPHKIKKILMDPGIRKACFKGCPSDEKKAIKAFVEANKENALKTKPKVDLVVFLVMKCLF